MADTVTAINDTGGTMHVYVGTVGATTQVGEGVTVGARPLEVLNLPPHTNGTFTVQGYHDKYVRYDTVYAFLQPMSATSALGESTGMDVEFTRSTTIRAVPNPADFNYRPSEQ